MRWVLFGIACFLAGFGAGVYMRDGSARSERVFLESYYATQIQQREDAAVRETVAKQRELCRRGLR